MAGFIQRPNLAGVITTADVSTKGQGNFKADYVNWARIAHLLHIHAPGWEFHLRMNPGEQGYVWKAPNDTGFVVGYFTGPDDQRTPDFPQSVMDNRNAPIPYERISARDLTDTHRRCLCTAAAYTFGLAYELWAKEEVENPYRDESHAKAAGAPQKAAEPAQPTLYREAGVHLAKLGITDFGIKTLLTICKVNSIEEISDKAAKQILSFGPDHVKMFDQGKNSKGEQVIAPPVKDQISEKSSIEELAKAAEEMFSDD